MLCMMLGYCTKHDVSHSIGIPTHQNMRSHVKLLIPMHSSMSPRGAAKGCPSSHASAAQNRYRYYKRLCTGCAAIYQKIKQLQKDIELDVVFSCLISLPVQR